MLQLIQNEILFFAAVAFVMFLPGYSLVLAVFCRSNSLGAFERFVVSFGISIISVDFILFAYSGLGITITRLSVIAGIIFFSAVCLVIYKFLKNSKDKDTRSENDLFYFTKNQFILILLLLFLTTFIKTVFLSGSIAPTATDLGHHLYWAKTITQTHQLTSYEGMPDFIIGEHTVFAAINILTGLSFLTGWPVVILYLINILGILTVFILTLRIFKNKFVAILTLLFLGVLYAISAPQAKYVSGGVMGNIFGNFLMPLAFYFYCRSFEFLENNSDGSRRDSIIFLSLAVLSTIGLFYTHHLTAFIFLFTFFLLIPLFLIVNYRDIEIVLKKSAKIIFSPYVIGTLIIGIIFFFFIFTPTYVNPTAVDTAVGAATKSTRVGLSITNLQDTVGEPRLALGFVGFIILILTFKRKKFGYSLLASWAIMIFIMSVFPKLLFIDLPSTRIGNYFSYPLAILSAYALYTVFNPESCQLFWGKKLCQNSQGLVMDKMLKGTFMILLTFVLVSGLSDSAQAFKKQDNLVQTNETFSASTYLSKNTTMADNILKDHNYITADSWIKLFFMRGYKYPLSRGYFKRYEESGNRTNDICTLDMISNPGGDQAKKCFSDTKTNFLMVNPAYDSGQFQRLSDFDQVYMSNDVAIYYKK